MRRPPGAPRRPVETESMATRITRATTNWLNARRCSWGAPYQTQDGVGNAKPVVARLARSASRRSPYLRYYEGAAPVRVQQKRHREARTMSSQPSVTPSEWKIKGDLHGKPKSNGFDTKKASDVSGIACKRTPGYPRTGLLADDETQGVQIVVLPREGKLVAGDFIRLINNTHGDELLELDAEGVAYADGCFYVTGSHGRPRHSDTPEHRAKADAKAKASRHVFRVRLDVSAVDKDGRLAGAVEITPSTKLAQFIKNDPSLGPALDESIEKNGISIEGVAIQDGNIWFGIQESF